MYQTSARTTAGRWTRSRLACLLIAGTAAAAPAVTAAVIPATAQAAVAEIYQCKGPDGVTPAAIDTFTIYGDAAMSSSAAGCTTNTADGLAILSSGGAGANVNAGFKKTLMITAPRSTQIVGGYIQRTMSNYRWLGPSSSTPSYGFGYTLDDDTGQQIEACGSHFDAPYACNSLVDGRNTFPTSRFNLPAVASSSYRMGVGCDTGGSPNRSGICYHYYGSPGVVGITAGLRVDDQFDPTVSSVGGRLATAANIAKDDESLSIAASDEGLGVYRVILYLDGQQASVKNFGGSTCTDAAPNQGSPYQFNQGLPCPQTTTRTFDFSDALSPAEDKTVRIQAAVEDAAGNSVMALDRTVKVDRVANPPAVTARPTLKAADGSSVASPKTNEILTVNPGSFSGEGNEITYAWDRCIDGIGCGQIAGATGPTYKLTAADVGYKIAGEQTATNAQGSVSSRTESSGTVAAPPSSDTGVTPNPAPGTGSNPSTTTAAAPTPPAAAEPKVDVACASPQITARLEDSDKLTVGFGQVATLRGRLTCDGKPLGGAAVSVAARTVGTKSSKDAGSVVTEADGTFSRLLGSGPGREVTVSYGGAAARATLLVKGRVSLKASARSVRVGGKLAISGRVAGLGLPRRYKLRIQFLNKKAGKWVTIAKTITVKASGKFRSSIYFAGPGSRPGKRAISSIRVKMTSSSSLGYVPAVSRVVTVRVR